MELTKEIKEILENVVYWDTCPKDYKEKINAYLKSVNESEALSIHDVMPSSLVRKVVFFELKEDCKYYAEDGTEITTDMLMKYPHYITNDDCYLILNQA